MVRQTMFMETTKVSAVKTSSEIETLLVEAGAKSIQKDYNNKGQLVALRFLLAVQGRDVPFRLPVKITEVYAPSQRHAPRHAFSRLRQSLKIR